MKTQGLNVIPKSYDDLWTLSGKTLEGATAHGAAIGLVLNPAAKIAADIQALYGGPSAGPERGKQQQLSSALASAADRRQALEQANAELLQFCGAAIDFLKRRYGRKWNPRWAAAGFMWGTLKLPDNVGPRASDLRDYFVTNPTHESAEQSITAARCDELINAVRAAQLAVGDRKTAAHDARRNRNAAKQQLRRRLSNLREELGQLLAPDDNRWYQFGFKRPADGRIPAAVEEVVLLPGLAGEVRVQWPAARLALNYRVTRQLESVDAEPVEVGLFTDRETTLRGLPSGAAVVVRVSARNASGESAPAEARLTVP